MMANPSTFEMSPTVLCGLRNLTNFSQNVSKALIANCAKMMAQPTASIPSALEVCALHSDDQTKQSEYAVVTLWALAVRHSIDAKTLRGMLLEEQNHISPSIVEQLLRTYEENYKVLLLRQLQIGHNFPHISDLQWRLVCDFKSSTSDQSSGEIGFHINFGRYETSTESAGERITIAEFVCNTEELQLLINKLKEIERHCEKLTTNE